MENLLEKSRNNKERHRNILAIQWKTIKNYFILWQIELSFPKKHGNKKFKNMKRVFESWVLL